MRNKTVCIDFVSNEAKYSYGDQCTTLSSQKFFEVRKATPTFKLEMESRKLGRKADTTLKLTRKNKQIFLYVCNCIAI